jgi:hypothetical protein
MRVFWTRLRAGRLWLGLVVAAFAVLVPASLASASHPEVSLPGSNFEIDTDANLKVDDPAPSIDWANVNETRKADSPSGQNDESFGQGTKEDTAVPTVVSGSIPPQKSDLKFFGVYQEGSTVDGFLNLFWSRVQEPNGTTNMDFEFNQRQCTPNQTPADPDCSGNGITPIRSVGDLLIIYDLDRGGTVPTLSLREWTGSAWGPATDLTASAKASGSINASPIPAADSDGLGSQSARTFGEAQLALAEIFPEGKCETFGSAYLKSRSATSFTSEVKDFVPPAAISLTNCGKVIIHKQTDPDGATDSFGYTHNLVTDPPQQSSTFSLKDGETQTFTNVLFGTGYTVTEDTLPSGWDLASIDCSASVGVVPTVSLATVTFTIDDPADVAECTFNNKARGKIIVEKITDDGTGSFDFTSSTLDPSAFTLTTTAAGAGGKDSRSFADLFPGTYDVAETVPAGWNLVSGTCDDGSDPASIGVSPGETVTCTFHDARERGAILVTKTRKHAADGSGDHPHAGVDFKITGGSLDANGTTVTTDANGHACLDGLVVSSFVGDYTVTEVVPSGYHANKASDTVSVTQEASCGDGNEANVSFHNTPLTNVKVSVDSQVDGGTASTIDCDGETAATDTHGDGSLELNNKEPTTITCTVVIDP